MKEVVTWVEVQSWLIETLILGLLLADVSDHICHICPQDCPYEPPSISHI